ncbi:hypothetical protein [Hydrogenophaga electricum]|uniref:Uncharacterized protein n=1 Tax=Hydrogenophaga electricum TaxID=1230953 RepID=A0ABQ6C0E0_9BURK|nr:hypothetical protein [Hydrogenophaga electricum]GLS13043.1 hypothetical protein GCM10007935_04710 [Hydrogenophaga electricum]
MAQKPIASAIARSFSAPLALLGLVATTALLTGCGTLTGLPAHGGGKRFATEQRLVSASVRAALMDIDITALKGKRAALVFDLVADEGGGNFSGGRWTPGLLFSYGSMSGPVTSTTNAFQVYNLADSGANYNNSASGGGSTTISTTQQSGSNSSTGISDSAGSSSSTSTGTSSSSTNTDGTNTNTSTTTNNGTSTTNGSGTHTSTTTGSGSSSGSSNSTTGGVNTSSSYNNNDSNTSNTNGSNTNTSTTTSSGSSTTNGSGTNASTTTGTGTSTNSGTGSSTSSTNSSGSGSNQSDSTTVTNSRNNGSSRSDGGYNSQRQEITPSPTESTTQTKGHTREATATLTYRGLGEYQNFPVPKSDASLLMGLVRNYFLLSGVTPTVPSDPTAEVLVYVTVDIFGTVRSRFDAFVYNNETVKAETSFEVMAFDRNGNNILKPQVSNREARYREHYLLWAGPLTTQEQVYQGQGLLVDFTQVDGQKAHYNGTAPVERSHPWGKN